MSRLDEKYAQAYEHAVKLGYTNEDLDIMFSDHENPEAVWDFIIGANQKVIDKWLDGVKEDLYGEED